jgi:predicted SnoaL-like aldol condensation-catalyzing enzyme
VTGMNIDTAATAATVIDVWNGAPVEQLHDVLASDYRGHMLHLKDGDRDAAAYPGLITQYRGANPGTEFRVVDQMADGSRLVSRLEARRLDGSTGAPSVARGINISRFDTQGRLAEEWAIWSSWMDDV